MDTGDSIFNPIQASSHEKFSLMIFERLETAANTIDLLNEKINSMAQEIGALKDQAIIRELDMKSRVMQRYLEQGMIDFPHFHHFQEDYRLSAWFTLAYNIQTAGYKLPERVEILEYPHYNISFGTLTIDEKNQIEKLCRPFKELCIKWSKQQDHILPVDFVDNELQKLATLLVLLPFETIIAGDFDPWCARWINRINEE